ncbi:MAG: hypothetical protein KAT05_03940 [Spirochaetes bacterium]|nr:hypothetical protein [Spirochaetota bacterium]
MTEDNKDLTTSLLILITGVALIFLANTEIEKLYPTSSRVIETLGITLTGYAPIRSILYLKNIISDGLTSKSINRNFFSKVKQVRIMKDLPIFFVVDIEGCITPPHRTQINLRQFQRLRGYCDYVKLYPEKKFPPFVIFTGRSQGYVELLAQSLGVTENNLDLPFVIENGSALYYPAKKKTEMLLNSDQRNLIQETQNLLINKLPNNEFEPKVSMVTINAVLGEETIDVLRQKVWTILNDANLIEKLIVSSTASSVDISVIDFNKISGIKRVLNIYHKLRPENKDKGLEHVIAMADSTSDLCVLKEVGKSYCPGKEAHPEICSFIEKNCGVDNIIDSSQIDFIMAVIEKETGLKVI